MTRFVRSALLATAGLLALTTSCNVERTIVPKQARIAKVGGNGASVVTPSIVISQVYGGGGNSGATFKNDFIELFNPGTSAVNIGGWSVQYVSGTGTGTWAVTALSGTIPAGAYYLVQEAAGAAGTVSLPTPDATGSIGMGATNGKVALVNNTTALAGGCPVGAQIVDFAPYGSPSSCTIVTPTLTNTTAALRGDGGCTYSGSASVDFTAAAPTPRNSASPTHSCGGPPPPAVAFVDVFPHSATQPAGATQQFTASATDASHTPIDGVTFTWTSTAEATVDATGLATGVSVGTATITATASGISGTATLTVTTPPPPPAGVGDVVISQAYGGGGNAGATLKNDFIEIFNRSANPVSVNGWSVQHASAAGTTWSVTPLSGTIPAGGYYLVQESQGAGGTVNLPTPDAVGTITMGATSGKDLISTSVTPFAVACPSGASVIDIISYGTGANCGVAAAAPSNTAGEQRKHSGCTWTQNSANDLVVAAPAPRNSASPVHSCVPGPLDHVTITGSLSVLAGATTQLSADAVDVNENSVPGATVTWVTSDAATATVNATGLVTGVANTGHAATITATAVSGAITKTASVDVQVSTPGGINWVDISSSSSSFPPGFQTELFATARESDGGTIIPAVFTFEAVNPDIATVATVANTGSATGTTAGIVTGVHAPSDGSKPGIRVTATPVGGGTSYSFVTHPITIEVPITAPPSIYAVNDEFGDPTPAATDHPDDMLIRRNQYVLSYNQSRGTPNWVSYELDARQLVAGADRCNCFAADPLLPVNKQILTSDYTNGGYDRGHMTRSADRTQANVDNAITFYLTNVVPQFGALNQGVWAQFENMLADSARAGKAVYIITGPLYSRSHTLTFLKGEGKVAIPDSTWKVALIGPGNGGNPFTHNSIQSYEDLIDYTLLAVNMRNHDTVGLRNTPPLTFQTTVDKIEQATGYDILSLLGAGKQGALDYHDRKPIASFSTSGALAEGSPVTFDASASSDPDIGRMDMDRTEALTYSWSFSDGTTAMGAVVTKTFANDGAYSATLTVTDAFGWPASTSSSVAIANVAPDIAAFAGATLLPGETYSASGSFADPGADVWTATADYGDGSGAQALSLSGQSFALSHTYAAAGTFTVTISVSDGLATSTRTQTVLVKTSAQGLQDIEATIDQLVAGGTLNNGNGNSLSSKLDAAVKQLQKGNATPARNQLNATLNEIDAMLQSGRLSPTDAATLRAAIERVLRSF